MMMGAATGFIAAYHTDNIALAILAGMLGSGFGALLYAVLTITFQTKQDVTGLALTIFGTGFANTLGKAWPTRTHRRPSANSPRPHRCTCRSNP